MDGLPRYVIVPAGSSPTDGYAVFLLITPTGGRPYHGRRIAVFDLIAHAHQFVDAMTQARELA